MQLLTLLFASLWALIAWALVFWLWWRRARISRELRRPALEGETGLELSLIICFKNEAAKLKELLPLWCEQDHPNFELIMVDDHSQDEGPDLVRSAQQQYPHLKLIQLKPGEASGKKAAQSKGILAASHDALVFTDADCRPASPYWLKHLALAFENHDVLLGYGPLEGRGLIGALATYETTETVLRYWSYAKSGRPYMGVGRNLAYRKSMVPALKALEEHADLISGDDDLTISELGKQSRVGLLSNPESYTYSPSPDSWSAWWRQKTRHYSTAWRYSSTNKMTLALEGGLQLFYVLLLPFALLEFPLIIVGNLIIARWILGVFIYRRLLVPGRSLGPILFYPFLEMIWVLATTLIHLRNLILGPPQKW